MWPARSYWRWNLRVCLLLALLWAALAIADGPGHGAGDIYFLMLLAEIWVFASLAVWVVLSAGHAILLAARRLARPF